MNYHQLKQYLGNNLLHGENSRDQNRAEMFRGLSIEEKNAIMTVVMPDGSRVWGVDISHWNLPGVDLQRMKDMFGLSFVFIKMCDGSLNTKYFPEHVATAEAAGIPWGPYVWLYRGVNVNIEAQTTAWSNRAKQYKPDLPVQIDAEWTKYAGNWSNPTTSDLNAAHNSFQSKYGEPAETYTSPGYANQYLQGFDFTKRGNWVAQWGVSQPTVSYPWEWHQFTSKLDGSILDPGGNLGLDGNYFNGNAQDFAARYGGAVPPTNGDDMKKGTAKVDLNIRAAPWINTEPPKTGILYKGEVAFGTIDASSGWLRIEWILRKGGDIDVSQDGNYCSGNPTYIDIVDYTEPEPPPAGVSDVPYVITLGDDVTYEKVTIEGTLKAK